MEIDVKHSPSVEHAIKGRRYLSRKFVAKFLRWIGREKLVKMEAWQSLHRQNTLSGIVPVCSRYDDPVIFMKQRASSLEQSGFVFVVCFEFQPLAQVFELILGTFPIAGMPAWEHAQRQVAKIFANGAGNARVLNFDGELLAGFEPRCMYLAQ